MARCVRCGCSPRSCYCSDNPKLAGKCLNCRKFRCICASRTLQKPADADKYTKGTRVDANGNVWCGTCSCRVMNYQCTNAKCSTYGKKK